MQLLAKVAGIAVILLIGAVGWIGLSQVLPKTTEINYRLTLESSLDGEMTSRSVVHTLRVSAAPDFGFPEQSAFSISHRGEALLVELPDKPLLLVLMRGAIDRRATTDFDFLVPKSCGLEVAGDRYRFVQDIAELSGPCVVPKDLLPLFIVIPDAADPNSIRRVDPSELDAFLGPDFEYRRLIVTVTRDEPSYAILSRLPWIAVRGGGSIYGPEFVPMDPPNGLPPLAPPDFVRRPPGQPA